jgi:hypothetical protein
MAVDIFILIHLIMITSNLAMVKCSVTPVLVLYWADIEIWWGKFHHLVTRNVIVVPSKWGKEWFSKGCTKVEVCRISRGNVFLARVRARMGRISFSLIDLSKMDGKTYNIITGRLKRLILLLFLKWRKQSLPN